MSQKLSDDFDTVTRLSGGRVQTQGRAEGNCIVCGAEEVFLFWRGIEWNLRVHCNDCASEVLAQVHLKRQATTRKKKAADLDLGQARSKDAYCLACGFKMMGGASVGLCPKCGSDRWYRTKLEL